MNIALSPEIEKLLAEKVECGEIPSADKLVELALTFYFDYEAGAMDQQDRSLLTAQPALPRRLGRPWPAPTQPGRA